MALLNTKQTYTVLDITEKTLYDWIKNNKITKFTKEGNNYFEKAEVLKKLPTVLTIYNHKGGVGKSALALIIAEYFEYMKNLNKILLIDFDAQANLTKHFIEYDTLYNRENEILSVADYFSGRKKINDIVFSLPGHDRIDILPAKIDMADTKDIDSMFLKNDHAPNYQSLFNNYELIIIDCPPAINMYSKFGLILANYVIAPVLLDPESLWGVANVQKLINAFSIQSGNNFIDYKVLINQKERIAAVREGIKGEFQKEVSNNIFKNIMPEFVGIVERGLIPDNVFSTMNDKEKKDKIVDVMKELEDWIYEQRPVKE